MLALFALVNALEALRYLLPQVPFPAEMDNFSLRRIALSLHGLGGAIALLAGSLQVFPPLPEKKWDPPPPLCWVYRRAPYPGAPHPPFSGGRLFFSALPFPPPPP